MFVRGTEYSVLSTKYLADVFMIKPRLRFWAALLLVSIFGFAGCGAPVAEFRRYETYAHKTLPEIKTSEERRHQNQQRQQIDEILTALFGTPDDPRLPSLEGIEFGKVVSPSRLKLAAGPVGSDERGNPHGLYREHCAHCHGITGDGTGPTASFLNPYPRDYRKGQFKFKSTPVGEKPTHDDLKKIVLEGIPGTAMPSFKLLPDLEVEALVDYVKYLSIRGEVERSLLRETANLEMEGRLVDAKGSASQQEQIAFIKNDVVKLVVEKWDAAPAAVTPVPQAPVLFPPRPGLSDEDKQKVAASVRHGRELFYGTIANCIKCHGDSALGDGQATDYDEWAKELIGDGKDRQLVATYVSRGLLPPRTIRPRNLRQGVFRGGGRPIDIYWRVMNGIEGTPMPAVSANVRKESDPPEAKKLMPEEIWDLVNYVRSLHYEPISNPLDAVPEAENLRERQL
jgi:mono/diheme cytochrome c family protein